MKLNKRSLSIAFLMFLVLPALPMFWRLDSHIFTNNSLINQDSIESSTSSEKSLLWSLSDGFIGSIPTTEPKLISFNGIDEKIVCGTDQGISILNLDCSINGTFLTSQNVLDIEIIGDINGDNLRDLIAVVENQDNPNIIAITSNNFQSIWSFNPTILGFNSETMLPENYTMQSWDGTAIEDLNSNGIEDYVFSSWYFIYAIEGNSGELLWKNEVAFTGNIWKTSKINDINGDSIDEIVAISENGKCACLDGKNGNQLWCYVIPIANINKYDWSSTTGRNYQYQFGISSMVVTEDITSDGVNEILIGGEDTYIYIINGQTGQKIGERFQAFNYTIPSSGLDFYGEPPTFSHEQRLYNNYGMKIEKIPDLNSDSKPEYAIFSTYLNPKQNYDEETTQVKIIDIHNAVGDYNFNLLNEFNISDYFILSSSLPEIVKNGSEYLLYYDLHESMRFEDVDDYYDGIYVQTTHNLGSTSTLNSTYEIRSDEMDYYPYINSNNIYSAYGLTIGDINGDTIDDVFFINKNGNYFIISGKDGNPINTAQSSESEGGTTLNTFVDINEDGIDDLLYYKMENFDPEWDSVSDIMKLYKSVSIIDPTNAQKLWTFVTNEDYYEGLCALKRSNDLNDDSIDDFVGLLIPSSFPQLVIDYLDLYDIDSQDVTKELAQGLLANYSLVVAIDGVTGEIFYKEQMNKMSYNYYRDSNYYSTYENPSSQTVYFGELYNRINGIEDESVFENDDYDAKHDWEETWSPGDLLHPIDAEYDKVQAITGGVINVSDLDANGMGYQELQAIQSGSEYNILVNYTFLTNLSREEYLGVDNFDLSQVERLSALKFQSGLFINQTGSGTYSFVYDIYNFTSGEWIQCNWSNNGGFGHGHVWNLDYLDLYGGYNTDHRSSYDTFSFSTSLLYDNLWLTTRGVKDKDSAVELNYADPTTLSDLVNENNEIKLRLNVTNSNSAFNLTLDTLGLQTYYWDLVAPEYDPLGIISNDGTLTSDMFLNLDICDFEVINATGDDYLDVILAVGYSSNSNDITNGKGARLILHDIRNNVKYSKWSKNSQVIPYERIDIEIISLSRTNSYILTGVFGYDNFCLKSVDNNYWEESISRLEDYDSSNNAYNISYSWINQTSFSSSSYQDFSYPITTQINENGDIGIQILEKGALLTNYHYYIVLNETNGHEISRVTLDYVVGFDYDDYNLEHMGNLKPITEDFNNDGYFDHVCIKRKQFPYDGNYYQPVYQVKVYSGKCASYQEELLLTRDIFTTYSSIMQEEICLGIIGDINSDTIPELCTGLQVNPYDIYDEETYDKGSQLVIFDFNSESNQIIELETGFENAYKKGFYNKLYNVEDLNQDNFNEILLNRYTYSSKSHGYSIKIVSELWDIKNQELNARFQTQVDDIIKLSDFNNDGKSEYIIQSIDNFYCVNSKFSIAITAYEKNLLGTINLKWNSNGGSNNFYIYVDGTLFGRTNEQNFDLSLSQGTHIVQIMLKDPSGIINVLDSIQITTPNNNTMMVITIITVVALIGISIVIKKRNKDMMNEQVVKKKSKKSKKNRGNKQRDLKILDNPGEVNRHSEELTESDMTTEGC